MKKYALWDKKTQIVTPTFEVFTAEQWMERYPAAKLDHITVVCSAGEINGAFFGTLNQLKQIYEQKGCDFSDCTTDEEVLFVIEAFDDLMKLQAKETAQQPSAEERIAAALEYQNLLAMENVQ